MPSTSFFPLPQRGLSAPAVAAINHLLAQEAWARDTLMRHAGKTACIDTGHVRLCMRVARDGMLESADSEALADEPVAVTIHVKLSDLPLILQNRDRAFSWVRIDGDAEFANTISQLSRGLRWDAEHDLERLFGPIGAVRLAGGARSVVEGAATAGRRLAESVAEFLLEERRVLVRPSSVAGFADDVSRLRDDVERAAKRLAKLEQKLEEKLAQKFAQRTAKAGAGPASAVTPGASPASTAIVPAPSTAIIEMPANALIEMPAKAMVPVTDPTSDITPDTTPDHTDS